MTWTDKDMFLADFLIALAVMVKGYFCGELMPAYGKIQR